MTQASTDSYLPDTEDSVEAVDFSAAPKPQTFRLRIELMDEGSHRYMLADTGNRKIKIRCYAAGGGENAMHANLKRRQERSCFAQRGGGGDEQSLIPKHGIQNETKGWFVVCVVDRSVRKHISRSIRLHRFGFIFL